MPHARLIISVALLMLLAASSAARSLAATPATLLGEVKPGTLAHALHVIEASTGGKVLEIRLLRENEAGFAAVVVMGPELVHVRVSALNDNVTRISVSDTPQWMLDARLKAEMHDMAEMRIGPEEAIRKAEQSAQGAAVDAAIARPITPRNQVLAYNVEVLRDGRAERVAVDARTGELISNPDAVLEPWTPRRLASQAEGHPAR
jgi:uncharacterized membrane protein YkoI